MPDPDPWIGAESQRLIRVGDIVTLSQAAERLGLSRAGIYSIWQKSGKEFPTPILKAGQVSIFNYPDVKNFYAHYQRDRSVGGRPPEDEEKKKTRQASYNARKRAHLPESCRVEDCGRKGRPQLDGHCPHHYWEIYCARSR